MKLLHAVVAQIADINPDIARPIVGRWNLAASTVHVRLWAAASNDSRLTSHALVQGFLLGVNDRVFWDLNGFPEVAELRAARFGELDHDARSLSLSASRKAHRVLNGPKS